MMFHAYYPRTGCLLATSAMEAIVACFDAWLSDSSYCCL